jgi:hypothetical protein
MCLTDETQRHHHCHPHTFYPGGLHLVFLLLVVVVFCCLFAVLIKPRTPAVPPSYIPSPFVAQIWDFGSV